MDVFKLGLEKRVEWTIKKYNIIQKGDKVIVALSGGKDSMTILHVLSKLRKKFGFNIQALHIDLGIKEWRDIAKEIITEFCQELDVPLKIVDLKKEVGKYLTELQRPGETLCHVCGIIKRWVLNKVGLDMKGTILATGHNADDQVQTFIMNSMRNNLLFGLGQLPRTGMESNKMFLQRVKPLFFCFEDEITNYIKKNNITINSISCPQSRDVLRKNVKNTLDISRKQQINVLMNSVDIINNLRGKVEMGKMMYCERCSFPSRNKTCQFCEAIK